VSVTITRRLRVLAPIVAIALALGAPGGVAADAELTATLPSAGSTVESPPRTIAARFNEVVVGDSSIGLLDGDGASIATGGIDPTDARRLIIRLDEGLPNGEYEVNWTVFASDGHLQRGQFSFTVAAPASAEPSSVPSQSAAPSSAAPSPTPEPTEAPVPTPSAAGTPTAPSGSDVLLPILATVGLVAVLGVFLLRGRRRAA
jgi:methionine-rich copper-binding protein CopC